MLADGRGLYLKVGASGSKSWVFRYVGDGRQHDMGLGPYPDVTLAMAREKALEQRRLRLAGQDPMTERKRTRAQAQFAAATAVTFKDAAGRYIEGNRSGWRGEKQEAQWNASLRDYVFPTLGSLSVADIDTGLILRVLEPIWNTKVETASRVRGRIEAVLDWAGSRGYRSGDNPARWKGHLEHSLPKPGRVKGPQEARYHAALPYAEMPPFMAQLRQANSIAAAPLEFAILTAARAGEVMGATWSEIDLQNKVWTIPASRMKASREHRVPLSDAAMAVLERMKRRGNYVFPAGHGGRMEKWTAWRLLRRMGRDVTAHGFRSTFSQWAAEKTEYQFEVREMALAHSVGSNVERAYQRSDLFERRRALMDDWGKFCAQPTTGDVVPLRSTRARG